MKTLTRLGSLVLLTVVVGYSAFAQGTTPRQTKSLAETVKAETAAGTIKPAHLASYYLGYDLTFARYASVLGRKQDAVGLMKLLSSALSGEDKEQIESCMRMITNGEGTMEQIDDMLHKVELSLETKLSGEPRWFYDLGKTYAQFFITLDYFSHAGDARPFRQVLIKLGQLAKTAPSDAPNEVVSSLAKLGKIGAKDEVKVEDVTAINESMTAIDTAMVV